MKSLNQRFTLELKINLHFLLVTFVLINIFNTCLYNSINILIIT